MSNAAWHSYYIYTYLIKNTYETDSAAGKVLGQGSLGPRFKPQPLHLSSRSLDNTPACFIVYNFYDEYNNQSHAGSNVAWSNKGRADCS